MSGSCRNCFAARLRTHPSPPRSARACELRTNELQLMNFASPFFLTVMTIVTLSLLGLPIGHAMIGASVLYLYLTGTDVGIAAEQLLNGMYTSDVLLAIP